jgi:hypothetical protein
MSRTDTPTTTAARAMSRHVSWLELSDEEEEATNTNTLVVPSTSTARDMPNVAVSARFPVPGPRIAPNAFIEVTIANDEPDSPVPVEHQSRRRKDNNKTQGSVQPNDDSKHHLDHSKGFLSGQNGVFSVKVTSATSSIPSNTPTTSDRMSVPANGWS